MTPTVLSQIRVSMGAVLAATLLVGCSPPTPPAPVAPPVPAKASTTVEPAHSSSMGHSNSPSSGSETHHNHRHHHHHQNGGRGGRCPGNALRGVYHSYRLRVLKECVWVKGTVIDVRAEDDGDYHVNVRPARSGKRLLDSKNRSIQQAALVTEIMPGQHLRIPSIGEHVAVLGTWVLDTEHGWNEIHPIWEIRYGNGNTVRALPPAKPRYESGGGGSTGGGGGGNVGGNSGGGGNGKCDSSYPTVCIPPPPPDLDCSQIKYRNFKVKGADPDNFDGDHDGIGCET